MHPVTLVCGYLFLSTFCWGVPFWVGAGGVGWMGLGVEVELDSLGRLSGTCPTAFNAGPVVVRVTNFCHKHRHEVNPGGWLPECDELRCLSGIHSRMIYDKKSCGAGVTWRYVLCFQASILAPEELLIYFNRITDFSSTNISCYIYFYFLSVSYFTM